MVEHYIEVRHLLKSYGDCLENGTTDSFGQKKAVQLLETTFNNRIISLNQSEQRIFSNFFKRESDWLQRASINIGTIKSHFGNGASRFKFGRNRAFPSDFYAEYASNLRNC